MDAIDDMYVVDLGWPWTSDKMLCECGWCRIGGVFKLITEKRISIHEYCMKEIKGVGK